MALNHLRRSADLRVCLDPAERHELRAPDPLLDPITVLRIDISVAAIRASILFPVRVYSTPGGPPMEALISDHPSGQTVTKIGKSDSLAVSKIVIQDGLCDLTLGYLIGCSIRWARAFETLRSLPYDTAVRFANSTGPWEAA